MILYDQNIPDSSLISYFDLADKPSINGIILDGSLSLNDLGITSMNTFNQQTELFRLDLSSLRGSKQDKLISGVNIKTVNGQDLLGNGNVSIEVPVKSVNGMVGDVVIDVPSLIPANYVTDEELNAKNYLTEIPANYVTETELDNRNYLTEIPANYLTYDKVYALGYATKDYVMTKDNLLNGYIQDISTRLKEDYFTRTEFDEREDEFLLKANVDDTISKDSSNVVTNRAIAFRFMDVDDSINLVSRELNNFKTEFTEDVSTLNGRINRVDLDWRTWAAGAQNNINDIQTELDTLKGDGSGSIGELEANKVSIGSADLTTLDLIKTIQPITEDEYESLTEYDPNTLYVIKK